MISFGGFPAECLPCFFLTSPLTGLAILILVGMYYILLKEPPAAGTPLFQIQIGILGRSENEGALCL